MLLLGGDILRIWGICPPPPHTHTHTQPHPSTASMSKFPSRENNIEKTVCLWLFLKECGFVWIWGVLNGLPHTPPSPASMSKFPSRGKQYWKNKHFNNFLWLLWRMEKMTNGTKMITSCSIRRVGGRWSIPRTGNVAETSLGREMTKTKNGKYALNNQKIKMKNNKIS